MGLNDGRSKPASGGWRLVTEIAESFGANVNIATKHLGTLV